MKISKKLIWDNWNTAHIKKHNVSIEEVEQVFSTYSLQRQTYANRLIIFGETKKGRKLTIIITFTRFKEPYVVSARDMGRKERRYYDKQTKTN